MTGPEVEKVMLVRVQVRNAAEATQRDKDRRTYTTRAKGPHQIPPVRATAFVGEEPVLTPRFDPYANDEWGKRTQVRGSAHHTTSVDPLLTPSPLA